MEWYQIAGIILGSGVLVALINQIGNAISEKRKRKYAVADKAEEKEDKIDALKKNTEEKFEEVRKDISKLDTTVNTLSATVGVVTTQTNLMMKSQKAQAYDRIRHLGMQHIKAGSIDPEDLRVLTEMYDAYLQLPGADGFLVKLMSEVNNLRIKID